MTRKIMANYESYRDSLLNLIQSGRIMAEDRGMKQRCSISCFTWLCISRLTFILILGCIGCGKPPIFHIVARNELANKSERYKIFLKGRELGTVNGSGTFEFDAEGRRGDTFQDMQPHDIEVRIPWVCGWVKTYSALYLARPDEIERARAEHRAVQASMSLSYMPPSFDWVTIFVDNRGGRHRRFRSANCKNRCRRERHNGYFCRIQTVATRLRMCASMKRLWRRSTPAKPC